MASRPFGVMNESILNEWIAKNITMASNRVSSPRPCLLVSLTAGSLFFFFGFFLFAPACSAEGPFCDFSAFAASITFSHADSPLRLPDC